MIDNFEVVIDDGRRKIFCGGTLYEVEEFAEMLADELSNAEEGDYIIREKS